MLYRIKHLIFGIVWIGAGYVLYKEGYDFKYGHNVPNETGFLLIAFGLIWIIFLVFRKRKIIGDIEQIDREEQEVFICKSCVKPFARNKVPELICPNCNEPLENLEGFYERHPELKA